MSMIKDMKTYLIARGVSEHIFLDCIPEGEKECIGLYRYAGQSPQIDASIERIGLQIKCRNTNYEEAIDECRLVSTILSEIGDEANDKSDVIEIDGTKYLRVYPRQSAVALGCDESGVHEIIQNFEVNALL